MLSFYIFVHFLYQKKTMSKHAKFKKVWNFVDISKVTISLVAANLSLVATV